MRRCKAITDTQTDQQPKIRKGTTDPITHQRPNTTEKRVKPKVNAEKPTQPKQTTCHHGGKQRVAQPVMLEPRELRAL
jgi:hypothetical protein